MGNSNMTKAKARKNDEFYTMMTDIEKEVIYYKHHLKNKTVYLNCDNPNYNDVSKEIEPGGSNFWKYFFLNFETFGLKKLIATYYDENEPTYKLEYEGGGMENIIKTPLKGNGDFRSDEAIELLKEADIVCTNPPFSLFRAYIAQLIKYNKDFLVMGNLGSVIYNYMFPLIKNNKIWLGINNPREFLQPNGEIKKFGNIAWFTNLKAAYKTKSIELNKDYYGNECKYPKYDNYDAIEVSRVKDIPRDFKGIMGVPITFLTKYNSNDFDIVGLGNSRKNFTPNKTYKNAKKISKCGEESLEPVINSVLTIEVDEKPKNKTYYVSDNSGYLIVPYTRLLIKRK